MSQDSSSKQWVRTYGCAEQFLRASLPGALAFVALCTSASNAVASPSIDNVQGPIIQGATVTVTGDGFSNADFEVVVKDEVESSTLLNDVSQLLDISDQDLWMYKGGRWASPLEATLMPLLGLGTNDYVYKGIGRTHNDYLRAFHGHNNNTIYVSWSYKPSESPSHSGGSNKFIRIWDAHSGEETRISWTQMHMTYDGNDRPSWSSWSGNVGEWNQMEIWVDGNSGQIRAYVNGQLAHKVDDFVKEDNGIGLNIKLLGFDPSYGGPYADMETFIDDLYASTTRARVIISDRGIWAEARIHGKIQMPSSWSDSTITFNLDTDDLGINNAQYLYIVNADGEVNERGFKLCGACPKPPRLTVN